MNSSLPLYDKGRADLIEILSELCPEVKACGHVVEVRELLTYFVIINCVGGSTIQYTISVPKTITRTKRYLWRLDSNAKNKLRQWLKHRLEVIAYQMLKEKHNPMLHKYLRKPLAVQELEEHV